MNIKLTIEFRKILKSIFNFLHRIIGSLMNKDIHKVTRLGELSLSCESDVIFF